MIDKKEKVKRLIIDYEEKRISLDTALSEINKLTSNPIDNYWLETYWKSIDIDAFVNKIVTSEVEDWQTIDDERAKLMIEDILKNITDDTIIDRNSTALEKRFSKPTGHLITWIFHENITDIEEILSRLKKNTSIAL